MKHLRKVLAQLKKSYSEIWSNILEEERYLEGTLAEEINTILATAEVNASQTVEDVLSEEWYSIAISSIELGLFQEASEEAQKWLLNLGISS